MLFFPLPFPFRFVWILNDLLEFAWFNVFRICYFVLTFTSARKWIVYLKKSLSFLSQSVSLSLSLFLFLSLRLLRFCSARMCAPNVSERASGFVWLTDFRRRLCTQWIYMFSFRIPHLIYKFEFGSLFVCNPRCVSLVKQISTIPFHIIFVRSLRFALSLP